jgi:alpha-N-arabinofuranosidase
MDSVQRLVIVPDEPIGRISPHLHGHFAEHLGELVYPGVFVGSDSPIPNTGGIRNDVVEALKPLEVPVLRWPGGCFADTYHWRDGIGPVEQRKMRINVHWGMAEEPNQFGTHEFMAFAHALGAEPYFAANLGSAAPSEMRDWIEYCNFDGNSALADERRANGQQEPYRIKYWGVGNENWGCGGNMSPEEYAEVFARYRTYVHSYPGSPVESIACGPNGADWNWTERFFEKLGHRSWMIGGFAGHYYCGTAGTATEYTESQWLELLAKATAIEGVVTGHRAIMDRFDPERKIKLLYDEWGTWHPVEKGKPSGGLYQQNTIRDACVAGLTLDVFHNHADKLFMANIAQIINVLQSVLLVEGDKVVKTPTYHVFDLYRPHKGAQAVRLISAAEVISRGETAEQAVRDCYRDKQPLGLRAVQGSASIKDGVLCLTAVNSHPTQPIDLDVELTAGRLETVEVVTLSAGDIHAHNTFENPDAVTLSKPQTLQAKGGNLRVTLPAGSVVRVLGTLS